jgi:hypothetical protein
MKNRMAWGLTVVLAVVVLIGAGVGPQHAHGTVSVANICIGIVPFEHWRVGYGQLRASHTKVPAGRCVDPGPLAVVLWDHRSAALGF